MPIKIPESLPATKILEAENIFVMNEQRAQSQDIRPLRIVVLNLMPKKIEAETQILRLLSNTPIQTDVELMQVSTHKSTHTSQSHLLKFYKTFDEMHDQRFDGLIITGAPVEQMAFEDVDYWTELQSIMDWSLTNVYSTLHICWGAQAGLYHHYGIEKQNLPRKMFGIFPHYVREANHPLLRGFDEVFYVPHSRHTGIRREDVLAEPELTILTESPIAGINCIAAKEGRQFFIFGHSEYERDTLANEYFRDLSMGLPIDLPVNYFPNNDPQQRPVFTWRAHANLLFANWLNYYVYQATPYDLSTL